MVQAWWAAGLTIPAVIVKGFLGGRNKGQEGGRIASDVRDMPIASPPSGIFIAVSACTSSACCACTCHCYWQAFSLVPDLQARGGYRPKLCVRESVHIG